MRLCCEGHPFSRTPTIHSTPAHAHILCAAELPTELWERILLPCCWCPVPEAQALETDQLRSLIRVCCTLPAGAMLGPAVLMSWATMAPKHCGSTLSHCTMVGSGMGTLP